MKPNRNFSAATLAAVLCMVLAGCIVSPTRFFDPEEGLTPLEPRRYEEQARQEDGTYVREDTVTLELEDTTYTLTGDDNRDPVSFTLHDAGEGLLIAMALEGEEAGYALVRIEEDAVLMWAAVCQVADTQGIVAAYPGIEDDGLSCTIPDRETLVAFMRDYAGAAEPDFRYIPQ